MVVADEEESGLGMVGGVAHYLVELGSDVDAAIGHQMVDIIDDDQGGLNLLDVTLDLPGEFPEVFPERAEHVEAQKVEAVVIAVELRCHFLEKRGTGVRSMYSIYPKDGGAFFGWRDCDAGGVRIVTVEDSRGEHLDKVVSMTGFLTSDISDVVLLNKGLIVERHKRFGAEGIELSVVSEETVLPGITIIDVGCAIIVDFHCSIDLKVNNIMGQR